ncbi:MAG: mannose-1-phosphate guanylyltransferase/mannose-6-phosphate isomerase, partial [Candidatus Omnitrophica bacterium]|nr:mannose-1-phosphate guanylyltransferase/mannose-6-phosphate isomerase [Candidatus Omnitrophota bacterium]
YRALEAVSFDHGVMDHLQGGLVVEGRFSWADLGSWETWAGLCHPSPQTVAVDSHNVTVVSQDRHLVATIGVRDLLVVHTPSATLICRPDKAQEVREVVKRLSRDPRLARYR